jgi:hypothetical protein
MHLDFARRTAYIQNACSNLRGVPRLSGTTLHAEHHVGFVCALLAARTHEEETR